MSALLELDNMSIRFGGLTAVDRVSFEVTEGEVVGLIGPNGAGKSTVFNVITGVYPPTEGKVLFKGEDITGLKPYVITARGIARTFQNIRLFKNLSVLDNVKIGRHCRSRAGVIGAIGRLPGVKAEEEAIKEKRLKWRITRKLKKSTWGSKFLRRINIIRDLFYYLRVIFCCGK